MVFGLIPLKTHAPNISADNSDSKKKIQGTTPTSNYSALISLGPEKLVGLNILGLLALIFSALVTGPIKICMFKIKT
jgi:hypothetical protein